MQSYPYDAELHHPKPKPAHGPIKIKQLEHVAKSKPSLKTRSVSDPGDAHRLVSRFVHEKTRSMTAQTSPPASPSARAFPFPSMAIRKGPQLENFMELDSTADEIGHDDPLALKMGQILARRAAAATRAISSRSRHSSVASGRRSVDSNGRRSIDSGRKSRLRIESFLHESKPKRDSALLVPPPVVVDDRSPHEGPKFWPRAPKSKGVIAHQPPGADESLNTFTFPPMPQPPPQSQFQFDSQSPVHFGAPSYQLSIQTRAPLTVQTDLDPGQVSPPMFPDDARSVSFVMQASPTSGVYASPVESVRFSTSFEEVEVAYNTVDPTTPPRVRHSTSTTRVQASPAAITVQTSSVRTSPIAMRIQTSPTTRIQPTRFSHSPTTRLQAQGSPTTSRIPVARQPTADTRYHSSPTTVYSQPSPSTPFQSSIPVPIKSPLRTVATPNRTNSSDAHINLLRGLSPLPSHGLPLPAPVRQTLKRSSLMGDAFASNSFGESGASMRESLARDVATSHRDSTAPMTPPEELSLDADSISRWTPPPPTTPPPHTHAITSTPRALIPTTTPPRPTRALSPIPARLRRTTLDPGSASDEVVFRKTPASASSTPQKRKRRRARLPVRAHSEGFIVPPGKTAQSLMRRGQTGDGGEMSSDGRDVVLFVPKSLGPPSRTPSPSKSLSRPPSPLKSASPSKIPIRVESPSKMSIKLESPTKASPSKLPIRIGSPSKVLRMGSPTKRTGSPLKQSIRVVPPPLVRRASIPLPEASPTGQAPPPGLGLLGPETLSPEFSRRPSIELREPIIVPPRQSQSLAHMPWSPPRHVLSRLETASREGSFHTARDSPTLATDIEFPSAGSPVHMDEEKESTTVHSAVTAEENPLVVQSAVRGTVSRPMTMTITRRPSPELGPRPTSAHSFRQTRLAPSPSFPGPSHTPNSSSVGGSSNQHMASIPVRRDQHYSPPGSLPESVTPPTDMSRPLTERSNSHLEEETFYSVHASDSTVENWIAVMNGMDANGVAITRDAFEEFQNSGDEGVVVADALSITSARRPDSAVILDDLPLQEDDNESGESGQSLSDVGTTTPSPSRSGSRHSVWLPPPPSGASTNLVIQTSGLELSEDDGNVSAFSINSDTSESNRLTVDQLQSVASIVHELNGRTPIPSASSSYLRSPPTSAAYVTPPLFVNPPPYRAAHSAPSRTLSPGAVSITFSEASPSLSTIPPPSLVVHSENRNWFADNLVLGGYRRSVQYLRDDDQRALEEGEDVVLYGGDWEHVGRRSESRATTSSAVPVEAPSDLDLTSADLQSRNKYLQFLLTFAGALRQPPPGSQRMVESALRTLRRQPSQPSPRYPEDLYDEIGRDEAGAIVVPPSPGTPRLPSHPVSSLSSSSSDVGSALPEEDEIVVRSTMTPQPPRILIQPQQESNVLPWPALPSPVSPRIQFARSVSRQTTRSQATSLTRQSGYSSLIPPPPRPRPRSMVPQWLTVYVAHRWPVPDTYVTRRTYSSPSALGPPMPYLWRPICHISPERLWEITNLEAQAPIPPQMPSPAYSPQEPPNARQHFPTPATTQNHATYSTHSSSYSISIASSVGMMLPPPPPIVPTVFRTSHHNLQIESLSELPPLPPSIPTLVERQMGNGSISPVNHLSSRLSLGSSSTGSNRPSSRPRLSSTRVVTPVAAMSRRRGLREFVGRLVGSGTPRARTRSIHSRSSGPFVPKPKFGVTGKVVEVTRRIFRKGRRARLSSVRSQTYRAAPET
ncbi:Mucin-5AC [Rhizoctonia solani]|uniref:Mucin-5AC n=1 Tax=Rhizoctonia solani TaxID=456999 RepID=A0A0K6FLC4_9AGAM|nr:Mucin-5AC [Rhizoctonia solani]